MTITALGGGTGNVVAVFAGTAANSALTIQSATVGVDNLTLVGSSNCAQHPASTSASIDCAYIINPTAGGILITVTLSGVPSVAWNIGACVLQSTVAAALDTAGNRGEASNTTSPTGPTLTLSGSNDAICVGERGNGTTTSSINGAYTNLYSSLTTTLNGAYLLNTADGTAANWTTSSGKVALDGIAFKEATGATSCKSCDMSLILLP